MMAIYLDVKEKMINYILDKLLVEIYLLFVKNDF